MKKLLMTLAILATTTLGALAADADNHKEILGLSGAEPQFVKADKSKADVSLIKKKKYTFIYFSAHWCPPCRAFTPKLVNFYNENYKNDDFELIFVSSDKDQDAMFKYMEGSKMPWLGLKYKDPLGDKLSDRFNVKGIPCLVLLDENDKLLASSYGDDGQYKGPGVALEKYKELHPVAPKKETEKK